jgi:hypothetical protein
MVNSADTTSGSSRGDYRRVPVGGRQLKPSGAGIIFWSAEPCRKLAVITAHLLREALDVVNRGRPFGPMPLQIGVASGGLLPVYDPFVSQRRLVFPPRPRIDGSPWHDVLLTTSVSDFVRFPPYRDAGRTVTAVALPLLVDALESPPPARPSQVRELFTMIERPATTTTRGDCSHSKQSVLGAADLCQRAIVGLADGWL